MPPSTPGVPSFRAPRRDAADVVDHFVALVLSHIDKEYPNKLDHVINDASEVKGPRALHPIFYGSFDWHSNVHGHWLLIRALRLFPNIGGGDGGGGDGGAGGGDGGGGGGGGGINARQHEIIAILDARFTPDAVAGEVAYLGQKLRATFERTYGWAWVLKLAAELREPIAAPNRRIKDDRGGVESKGPTHGARAGTSAGVIGAAQPGASASSSLKQAFQRWATILQPLADAFVERHLSYLPKATYPIRVGVHQNTAFALALAWDYARVAGHDELAAMVQGKAREWYIKDRDYHGWEPGGTDFLSPGLMEAECMRRVLPGDEFLAWFDAFLPRLAAKHPAALFEPAFVSDRTDGQITHLDGLNLSRAWCFRSLAAAIPVGDDRQAVCEAAFTQHLESALPHVSGDYMGEHWLATFALLAMTE